MATLAMLDQSANGSTGNTSTDESNAESESGRLKTLAIWSRRAPSGRPRVQASNKMAATTVNVA